MKQLYIIAASLMTILAVSCKKDNTTYADHPLPSFAVSGLQQSYTAFTHRDTLRIHPSIPGESQYDFFWTAFTTIFVQGTGQAPRPDTLSKTKDLDYEVLLNPGQYILVFNMKDRQTGVTKLITLNMSIATLNMNGWYLLKDNGGKTDFDFIHKDGRIDNWIAFYNDGKSLEGNAVKAVFTPSFKMSLTSTALFNAFTVLTDKDAAIYRIDNGKMVRSFDDMFFSKPATRKLQNVFQSSNTANLELINDNKAYSMNKGALFTDLPPAYKVSPVGAVGAMDIGFDENSNSVICFNNANYAPLTSNGNELKNMNANLIWMNGYAGQRSVAVALFRMPTGEGVLIKLNAQYGYLAGYTSPLVQARDTLASTHGLMRASVIGGNYDADYFYYAINNNIFITDLATRQETPQVTLPAGETVTCIQHIKYPQPTAGVPNTTDFLAIASYANGHYKVWLHKISSTGTITPQPQPNFEGTGRVTNVTYVEQGLGSRVF